MKKLVLLTLSFMVMVLAVQPLAAMEEATLSEGSKESVEIKYAATGSIDAGLKILSSGKAVVSGEAVGYGATEKVTVKLYLKRLEYDSWVTVRYWSSTEYSNGADIDSYYYVRKGYDYKVVFDSYMYDCNNNLLEYLTNETPVITY